MSKIQAVAAYDFIDKRYGNVTKVKFLDGKGEKLYSYNPYRYDRPTKKVFLDPSEQLIGVYGTYQARELFKQPAFNAFGFIVKKRQ